MKLCKVCGQAHPDDVTTAHHPNGCKCGSSLCGGCIWVRHFEKGISDDEARVKYRQLKDEYAAWQASNPEGKVQ